MIRAVLFDLDETLIDRTETMRRFLLAQYLRFTELHRCTGEEYAEACLGHQQNGYADKFYPVATKALSKLTSLKPKKSPSI